MPSGEKTIAKNRKARHQYHVLESFEAGIVLAGTEVKSCRQGNVSLVESYARVDAEELWLLGAHIAPYAQGNRENHTPVHPRKLLVHRREIRRLARETDAKGLTLIPLRLYFRSGRVKVELGLCRGKNVRDKRETLKKRMHEREAQAAMRRR